MPERRMSGTSQVFHCGHGQKHLAWMKPYEAVLGVKQKILTNSQQQDRAANPQQPQECPRERFFLYQR
jgi:hypothetical protein